MRKLFPLLVIQLLALVACVPAHAQEKRIALLIGNQAYDQSVGALKNPHNDIELVAQVLRQQGFDVIPLVKDARRSVILQNVRLLANHLILAGPGAIGFLYYSGHGAAERDTSINYLIPIDARDPGTTTFWDESLKLDDIMRLLDRATGATKFVVFDACRSELQLPIRDTTKGLLPVQEQRGFFIAYATGPGKTASDQGADSGPYAAALAAELRKPGLDHLNLFQNVKEAVITATGGVQYPWESNGLSRRVFLTQKPAVAAIAPARPPSAGASDIAQRDWSALMSEYALWEKVRTSDDPSALRSFLDQFPTGVFAATARQMMERLRTSPVAPPSPPPPVPPSPTAAEPAPAVPAPVAAVPDAAAAPTSPNSSLPVANLPGPLNPPEQQSTVERPVRPSAQRPPPRPRCDDDERLVKGRCVPIARPKPPSKVREAVLKTPPRPRPSPPPKKAAPAAAAPTGPTRMCFNSGAAQSGNSMVACSDPRAIQ